VGWRTKTANARPVAHPSRGAAEAEIEDLRRRYHAGAKSLRVVRLYGPDGSVRLIDFARDDRDAAQALRAVERATAARDRAIREATDQWEKNVARAVALGQDPAAVAKAAGTTVREIRSILRRKSRQA
jgi:hypothetical protein